MQQGVVGDHALRVRRRRRCRQVQAKLSKNATMFNQFRDGTRSFRPRNALNVRYSLLRLLGCQDSLDQDSQSVVNRFVHGERGISLETAAKLCSYLKLNLKC